MSNSKLIELSYYDPSAQVRLSAYADTIVLDHDQNGSIISAIRFGGYPERSPPKRHDPNAPKQPQKLSAADHARWDLRRGNIDGCGHRTGG